jgi:pimeloyl-ACP methyl ester carboxylesterase
VAYVKQLACTSHLKANSNVIPDDWRDNARDIAHFLLHYLPEDASSKTLPTHLHLLAETISEYRKAKGFRSRTLVTVGHSFGGCSLCVLSPGFDTLIYSQHRVYAVVDFPELFSSVVLLDPVITQNGHPDPVPKILLSTALARRSNWASR